MQRAPSERREVDWPNGPLASLLYARSSATCVGGRPHHGASRSGPRNNPSSTRTAPITSRARPAPENDTGRSYGANPWARPKSVPPSRPRLRRGARAVPCCCTAPHAQQVRILECGGQTLGTTKGLDTVGSSPPPVSEVTRTRGQHRGRQRRPPSCEP